MKKSFWEFFLKDFSLRAVLDRFGFYDKLLALLLVGVMLVSFVFMMKNVYKVITLEVPKSGGELDLGVVGSSLLLNPLFATGDEERDLVRLIYSGLMRFDVDGNIVEDIAEEYEVFDDGLRYVFVLRDDVYFHDGRKLTADDVVFTVNALKNPVVKSPFRVNFDGVSVKKIGEYEVEFKLDSPYAGFMYNMTMGILPSHLWRYVPYDEFPFASLNSKPVGAGMYYVDDVRKGVDGLSIAGYELRAFQKYYGGKPYIETVNVHLYSDEVVGLADLKEGRIGVLSYVSGELVSSGIDNVNFSVYSKETPRIFLLFMNSSRVPALDDEMVRGVVYGVIDPEYIVQELFGGYASEAWSVFPAGIGDFGNKGEVVSVEEATDILEGAGFVVDDELGYRVKKKDDEVLALDFDLVIPDSEEVRRVADYVVGVLGDVGIRVEIVVKSTSDMLQDVIPQRDFELMIFGETFQYDTAIYAYWHSSQRLDPGLNVASYVNTATDRLLQNAVVELDKDKRFEYYEEFNDIILEEKPVKPLYSPVDLFVVRMGSVYSVAFPDSVYAGAFDFIDNWYVDTERVLRFFGEKRD